MKAPGPQLQVAASAPSGWCDPDTGLCQIADSAADSLTADTDHGVHEDDVLKEN